MYGKVAIYSHIEAPVKPGSHDPFCQGSIVLLGFAIWGMVVQSWILPTGLCVNYATC